MSEHHRAQRWTTFNTVRRAELEQQLPLPCIQCGRAITRETPRAAWQVGHRVDAARGGQPTRENTGPIHTTCNRRTGGKLGAAIANAKRASRRANEDGLRQWY